MLFLADYAAKSVNLQFVIALGDVSVAKGDSLVREEFTT